MNNIKEGILPVNKPAGKTSFSLISVLRFHTKIKKIGHAGTLDPFAEGVMILLIGPTYTKQAALFTNQDKEYLATLHLGIETTTFDPEGEIVAQTEIVPTDEEVQQALTHFQGKILQTPPMFSAKKVNGQRLYSLARKGITIERVAVEVQVATTLLSYNYPELVLQITCSKGTYIRSIASDLGKILNCGAFLKKLIRTRCGPYHLKDCIEGKSLFKESSL